MRGSDQLIRRYLPVTLQRNLKRALQAGLAQGATDYLAKPFDLDDLLALVTTNLCIDESRVFTTGFSYGAMMSFGLTNGRPSKLRAAVTMAPSQFGPSAASGPIAYMSTTGMDDGTCRWVTPIAAGRAAS